MPPPIDAKRQHTAADGAQGKTIYLLYMRGQKPVDLTDATGADVVDMRDVISVMCYKPVCVVYT